MTLVHLLEKWYAANPSIKPHPALMEHDKLHAILGEPPTWQGEVKVGVMEYVYKSLVRGNSLTIEGARAFLQTVIKAVNNKEAYDFLSESELSSRISASVRILRSVGLENIQSY
jgi:hypothetical protein